MKNQDHTSAPYGYIITATRGLIADGYSPLGVVASDGSYDYADASVDTGVNLAVYPTPDAASAAMIRAARGSDPVIWDGLVVRTLGRAWHDNAITAQCVVYGCLTYPDGEPESKFPQPSRE